MNLSNKINSQYFNTKVTKVSKRDYQNKLHGFWLGHSIANWTGLITEMDKVGTKEIMPFYTDNDWGKPDLKAMWGEYLYQFLYEEHQTSLLKSQQIKQGWLKHIYSEDDAPLYKKFKDSKPLRENFLWESNQQARLLMAKVILPPDTSKPKNNGQTLKLWPILLDHFIAS